VKFCYVDESGNGEEPYLVVAAVAVDANRMHITKAGWADLFADLTRLAGRTISELKASDLYSGNHLWRDVSGSDRAAAIDAILRWLDARRHQVLFTAIDKCAFETAARTGNAADLRDPWCAAAFHIVLQLQKAGRGATQPKGHFAVIFDAQERHEFHFVDLVRNPPRWSDAYYGRGRREAALSRLVDVPYFADSEHVLLIQVADLITFVLRRHAELTTADGAESYGGEADRIRAWSELIARRAGPASLRWKRRGRNAAESLFADIAPAGLLTLGSDETEP
jgi:hypothetical protein